MGFVYAWSTMQMSPLLFVLRLIENSQYVGWMYLQHAVVVDGWDSLLPWLGFYAVNIRLDI